MFFVLAALVGCKDKGYVPDHPLTEQEMIAIMTDVQIIEADINRQKTQERERVEHYGITDSIFTQNIQYYTEHPADLERIMDSVMQRLMKEQAEP